MKRPTYSFTILSAVLALAAITSSITVGAQQKLAAKTTNTSAPAVSTAGAKPDAEQPWWQHAIFYEIYPRSFADAKNKGTGNIAGITSKLDYLKSIGVGAIWITPCFPSPQVDFGYDISNYKAIAPEYGTMADFDKLLAEAKKRDIKIVLDFVMNHTSDKHQWFIESKSARANAKHDWYIWRDGKQPGVPPNNWQALFGHSAWQLDPVTKQYYYHFFYPQQPDLNWRNPQVRNAMYDSVRFWLDKGVAGFRLDAVNTLFEDPTLKDNPLKSTGTNRFGDPDMENKYNYLLPEIHDSLRELRSVLNKYPDHRVLIGETTDSRSIADLARMYGENDDEIQLPMNFMFAFLNKLSAADFRKQIGAADKNPAHGWPVYLFSNHDEQRAYNRYADGKHNDQIAKLLATMLYTLRGTPILYYGEELGMANNDPQRIEDVKDPIGKLGWPKYKGRDGERTPMQWSPAANAGFSTVKPWLPVGPAYKSHNVLSESNDPNSVLNFYKGLASVRSSHRALYDGDYIAVNDKDPNVLSYLRRSGKDTVLVALNMSSKQQTVKFELSANRLKSRFADVLLSSGAKPKQVSLSGMILGPYQALVTQIKD